MSIVAVKCWKCESENASNRKFCSECGTALFAQCGECNANYTSSDKFCGECGENLTETVRARVAEVEGMLAEAKELQRSKKFDIALSVARRIAIKEHPVVSGMVEQAKQLAKQLQTEREQAEGGLESAVETAREYLAKFRYDKAYAVLSQTPESLRTPDVRRMIADVEDKRDEVADLTKEIRECVASGEVYDLLPQVARLLSLNPTHQQAPDVVAHVLGKIGKRAKQLRASMRYQEALDILNGVPAMFRNDKMEKIADEILELAWLEDDLRRSPFATKELFNVAKRFQEIDPDNERAKKLVKEIGSVRAKQPDSEYPKWANAPPEPRITPPPEPGVQSSRLGLATNFFVAGGLALQGVGLADVDANFIPKSNRGLGRFSLSFGKSAKASRAWGVDIGSHSLKAVCLERDGDSVRVAKICELVHEADLDADDELEFVEIATKTLGRFRDENDLTKSRICASINGSLMIARYVHLPPVAEKDVPKLLEAEVKMQIPFPIDDLQWRSHVVEELPLSPELDSEDLPPKKKGQERFTRRVLFLAVKNVDLESVLAPFERHEMKIDELQCDCIAIHNLISHEFDKDESNNGVSVWIDVGARKSGVLFSGPKALWFRSFALGGRDINKPLCREFNLTHSQADKVRRSPCRVKRLSAMYEACSPVFEKITSEVERSMELFRKQYPDQKIQSIRVLGGASKTHGLFRYLYRGTVMPQ